MTRFARRYWYGAGFALLASGGSLVYSRIGPLPAGFNWAALAVIILVAGMCALALVASLAREPNPLGRTYPLYNLKDLPPQRALDSGSADLLWHALPMAIAAAVLVKFFARF